MGYPNSTEEIDPGMIMEGIESLEGFELAEYRLEQEQRKSDRIFFKGHYGYWLDNCGDESWYCEHCIQPECGKREAKCSLLHE